MQLGTGNRAQAKNYINIFEGKFERRVPEGTPGSIARQLTMGPNTGDTIHVLHTTWLAGYISDITLNTTYEPTYYVDIDTTTEVLTVQLKTKSMPGLAFASVLPNVKLNEPVKFSLSVKQDEEGKDQTSMFINQDWCKDENGKDKALAWAFTKANPNGMPEKKYIKVNGKDVGDRTEQLEFLWNMIETTIIPNLTGNPNATSTVTNDNTEKTLEETHGDLLKTDETVNPEDAPF